MNYAWIIIHLDIQNFYGSTLFLTSGFMSGLENGVKKLLGSRFSRECLKVADQGYTQYFWVDFYLQINFQLNIHRKLLGSLYFNLFFWVKTSSGSIYPRSTQWEYSMTDLTNEFKTSLSLTNELCTTLCIRKRYRWGCLYTFCLLKLQKSCHPIIVSKYFLKIDH
jgi:hypothetical protein